MFKRLFFLFIGLAGLTLGALGQTDSSLVYVLKIQREIGSTAWVHTQKAFDEASKLKPVCILIHMNTYGGEVVFADSIRTRILNSKIPVHVFIDNNAASAGALIAIACDSIYMRPGANMGAATVVNQNGEKMPDKYQSYMRSTIRATAESHGADTIISANDTIIKWVRDPRIAEAMVDERSHIPGVVDSGKILTFTALEAIRHGYCEGEASNYQEVFKLLKLNNPHVIIYEPTFYDGIKGFLTSPFLQGILILVIIGGIYFELQSPGIGFPLAVAIIAAVLYFAPLYLDGLAQNWEILIFIIGVLLVGIEIFAIPGFGIIGVSGIVLIVMGLVLSLLNNVAFDFSGVSYHAIVRALLTVVLGLIGAFFAGIWLTRRLVTSGPMSRIALKASQDVSAGYVGVDMSVNQLIGSFGVASTILRPSGKVLINGELYDAVALTGYINAQAEIKVVGMSSGQLQVVKKE